LLLYLAVEFFPHPSPLPEGEGADLIDFKI
jgi:hypothetical protein